MRDAERLVHGDFYRVMAAALTSTNMSLGPTTGSVTRHRETTELSPSAVTNQSVSRRISLVIELSRR
jgi:hypothetical protein